MSIFPAVGSTRHRLEARTSQSIGKHLIVMV
jgi:hypothetical protein